MHKRSFGSNEIFHGETASRQVQVQLHTEHGMSVWSIGNRKITCDANIDDVGYYSAIQNGHLEVMKYLEQKRKNN